MLLRKPNSLNRPRNVLSFRELSLDDVPRIAELAGDWDVSSMTGRIPYPYSEAAAMQWLEAQSPGEILHAVVVDEEFVGVCGLSPLDDDEKAAEVGYWFGKPYWGRGFATKAVGKLVMAAFKQQDFARLSAAHAVDNPASGRVLQKLGFKCTGPTRCWCEARAGEVDALRYELVAPKSWWRVALSARRSK